MEKTAQQATKKALAAYPRDLEVDVVLLLAPRLLLCLISESVSMLLMYRALLTRVHWQVLRNVDAIHTY